MVALASSSWIWNVSMSLAAFFRCSSSAWAVLESSSAFFFSSWIYKGKSQRCWTKTTHFMIFQPLHKHEHVVRDPFRIIKFIPICWAQMPLESWNLQFFMMMNLHTVKHLLFAWPYFRNAIIWEIFTRLYFHDLSYYQYNAYIRNYWRRLYFCNSMFLRIIVKIKSSWIKSIYIRSYWKQYFSPFQISNSNTYCHTETNSYHIIITS